MTDLASLGRRFAFPTSEEGGHPSWGTRYSSSGRHASFYGRHGGRPLHPPRAPYPRLREAGAPADALLESSGTRPVRTRRVKPAPLFSAGGDPPYSSRRVGPALPGVPLALRSLLLQPCADAAPQTLLAVNIKPIEAVKNSCLIFML